VPHAIAYGELRELLDGGAQLVEVLPREDYEELHIPGAISIPIKELDETTVTQLDRARPVVTYCWDSVCDLSARAARRLADLGLQDVYDYFPSKVDWMARGLELEGERAGEPRALDFAGPPVVTCRLGDRVGDVRGEVEGSAYRFALVVGEDQVLLGRLRGGVLGGDPGAIAGEVMEPGPSTNRPNTAPEKLLEKLRNRDLKLAILTDPEGRLLGVVRRSELERALA
jgi:rhodanese-related sulfurtransferase